MSIHMKPDHSLKKIEFNKDIFIKDYMQPNQPIILKKATSHWRALHKWELEYLEKTLKNFPIKYRSSDSVYHPNFYQKISPEIIDTTLDLFFKDFKKKKNPLFLSGEFFNLYSKKKVKKELKVLWNDFSIPGFIKLAQVELIGLWLSGKGVISWLHYDGNGAHNFNAQIKGRKKVILISPDQANLCYINSYKNADFFNFSRVDIKNKNFTEFPKFKNVKYYVATLNAGEVLYIPPFWLHSFEHLDEYNLNLNFWWHSYNTNISSLALRGNLLYSLRKILCNNNTILTRQQLVDKLEKIPSIKALIDELDASYLSKSPEA